MNLILINGSTFVNVDAIAYAELESGLHGETKLRVVFVSGMEVRLTGAKMRALLMHLEACAEAPREAPGLAVPDEEHIA
jgi:hypothetical protein